MIKTTKSMSEKIVLGYISRMEELKRESKVKTSDVDKLIMYAFKILEKCEELRKSRDNHNNNNEMLKIEIRELKKQNIKLREGENK